MNRILIATIASCALVTPALAIEPGSWKSTGEVVSFDMAMPPGMPASVTDMIKKQMTGKPHSSTQCIKAEDIENAPEKMFKQSNGDCRYTTFDMSGGKLDAVAKCSMEGATMTMTMTGSYTDTTYDSRMEMTGDAGMGKMTIISVGNGTRVGDCG
ncbi:MAG: DUF3617 domain-containing protein [Pacificimonas sp.]